MSTYQVHIKIFNRYNELIDQEIIESDKSLSGAKNKATRFMNRTFFMSDFREIEKRQISKISKRADWWYTEK